MSYFTQASIKNESGANVADVFPWKGFFTSGYGTPIFQDQFRATLETAFKWEETIAGSATQTITNTVLTLGVTTGATDSVTEKSRVVPPFIIGSFNTFRAVVKFTSSQANNKKSWGVQNTAGTDGYIFRLDGTALSFVTTKGSSETPTNIDSFKPTDNLFHLYEIVFVDNLHYYVFIDKALILTGTSPYEPKTNSKELQVYFRNYNTGALGGSTGPLEVSEVGIIDNSNSQSLGLAIDDYGNIRNFRVDTAGSIRTTSKPAGGSAIALLLDIVLDDISGVTTANIWEMTRSYTVPAGYNLEITNFTTRAGNATSWGRVINEKDLGTYNQATGVFTAGSAYITPYFGGYIEAEVTATTAGGSTLTITYTNSSGVTGRTATITVPTGAVVGQHFIATLQGQDIGVLSVQNVTDAGGTAGTFSIKGVNVLFIERMTSSDTTYHQITSRESVIVAAGETIEIHKRSSQTASVDRLVSVVGILQQIV